MNKVVVGAGSVVLVAAAAAYFVVGRTPAPTRPPAEPEIVEAPRTEPFYDHTLELSQAFGLQMIERRLTIAETYTPANRALRNQIAKMPRVDLDRFLGTLAERDRALSEELFRGLWDVVEAVDKGVDVPAKVAVARAQVAKAREVVLDPALRAATPFKAAMLADQLVAGDGVGEAFEEAFKQPWEYPNGVMALRQAKDMWAEFAPQAKPAQRTDATEAFAMLDKLYATKEPPDMRALGLTPEEAEAPAHRMAGVVEQALAANLFPGREPVRLAKHLQEMTKAACVAYDTEKDYIGKETLYAVGHHYGQTLAGPLSLTAPRLHAGIREIFGLLLSVDDLIEDVEPPPQLVIQGGAPRPPADDDDDEPTNTAPGWLVCPDLEYLMGQAVTALGG